MKWLGFLSFYASVSVGSAVEFVCQDSSVSQLFADLETVGKIDKQIHDRLPLVINYQLQGGYFAMPSARTFDAGILGFGFSYVPPYRIWSLGFQFFDHIETTGNYWIFHGLTEANFGHLGFGDDAERSANIKFILLRKEDGFPFLPDFAVGWNDLIGTRRFNSFYVAATQEFLDYHLEATFGWGTGRIKGFYGGLAWTPWHRSSSFLKGLTFAAEYDANDYKRHVPEHAAGREVSSRINAGVQLKLWNLFRFSASTLRGNNWAASGAIHYDLGSSQGFFPKYLDTQIYTAPVDTQPLGVLRTRQELAQDLAYAFKEQGFDLYTLYLIPEENGKDRLWMKIINVRYRQEEEVRKRIEYILAALSPSNIEAITAVVEADGVPINEYRFRMQDLKRYAEGKIGDEELRVIAPMREASSTPSSYDAALLYHRNKRIWMLTFRPWLRSYFGTSRGKYKYEIGFSLSTEGYLFNEIYYYLNGTYTVKSSTQSLNDQDFLNPSRLLIVRTDSIRYNQANSFHLEQGYAQKSWNLGEGWFTRVALGYFEMAYGGLSWEALYYPVYSSWAIGFEAATVLKRRYYGFNFDRKVRKLTSEGMRFFPFTGFQYFVDFYYEYKPFNLDFKFSAGQFLARDKGIRMEASRTFLSDLRVGIWYTLTNAKDEVNNSRYYDKGFFISMPLDLYMNQTSRTRISYAMSAWLRDCGAQAATGKRLYPTLYWERYNTKPVIY